MLEARCKELQGLLEQTQGQRSEHRQALKVLPCCESVRLDGGKHSQRNLSTRAAVLCCKVQRWQPVEVVVLLPAPIICLVQEERAAREAAELQAAESSTQHQHELQQLREQMQAQLEAEADSRQSVETQLGSLQSELQVSACSSLQLQPCVCPACCCESWVQPRTTELVASSCSLPCCAAGGSGSTRQRTGTAVSPADHRRAAAGWPGEGAR